MPFCMSVCMSVCISAPARVRVFSFVRACVNAMHIEPKISKETATQKKDWSSLLLVQLLRPPPLWQLSKLILCMPRDSARTLVHSSLARLLLKTNQATNPHKGRLRTSSQPLPSLPLAPEAEAVVATAHYRPRRDSHLQLLPQKVQRQVRPVQQRRKEYWRVRLESLGQGARHGMQRSSESVGPNLPNTQARAHKSTQTSLKKNSQTCPYEHMLRLYVPL